MGKLAEIEISQSVEQLKSIRSKESSARGKSRINALIHLKEQTFRTRQELANHLQVHIRTLERWLSQYVLQGMNLMIKDAPKNKGSKIITKEIHEALKGRVSNSEDPFLGYWEAQKWVNENFDVQIKYQRIREYMIKHFKTKLKTPRKSHVKKDKQAIEAFLKTT